MSLTLAGLLNYIGKRKAAGTLKDIAGPYGLVNCAFICCDLPYQYVDEYFDKLGDKAFHPIHNEVCDLIVIFNMCLTSYRTWLLSTCTATTKLGSSNPLAHSPNSSTV